VALKADETASQYRLSEGILASGVYASVKLECVCVDIVRQIVPTFEDMYERHSSPGPFAD
jgi:hypothetical protein